MKEFVDSLLVTGLRKYQKSDTAKLAATISAPEAPVAA
jgi:hypothetical protein